LPDDWIECFLELTDSIRSPRVFRLWAAIGTLSAILERHVWTKTDVRPLYPNTFVILAGHPGSGKSVGVGLARGMLGGIRNFTIGPDNPTEASFLDALYASAKAGINGTGGIIHSAMAVLCREFGVFLPKYSDSFLASLADLWDNPPILNSPRRTSRSLVIENPTVNILAAATPAALGYMPESAWNEGFASRCLFIYGSVPKDYRDIFKAPKETDLGILKKRLEEIFHDVHGEFEWTDNARNAILHWFNDEGQAPLPTYGRLAHYLSRRNEHLMKLSMISAVSAGNAPALVEADFRRAQSWLFAAEQLMPDVFRAMQQKSDTQLLQDAHHWAYVVYSKPAREQRKPLNPTVLWTFFENKVTSDRIPHMIETMLQTGRLKKDQFGYLIPGELDITQNIE
jgi:Protein of unknown function (DUF3987)